MGIDVTGEPDNKELNPEEPDIHILDGISEHPIRSSKKSWWVRFRNNPFKTFFSRRMHKAASPGNHMHPVTKERHHSIIQTKRKK